MSDIPYPDARPAPNPVLDDLRAENERLRARITAVEAVVEEFSTYSNECWPRHSKAVPLSRLRHALLDGGNKP